MSLPQHTLSNPTVIGYLLFPDNADPSPLMDYELGGVALNDPSQGLRVKTWYCKTVIDGVKEITSISIGASDVVPIVFLVGDGITEASFAFDQNMNPVVAYMQNGQAKFYWFDTAVSGYVTTVLPAGTRSPKCCLDDKRPSQVAASDILLFYARGTKLYYREQRDRYLVEYELANVSLGEDVLVAGMTDKLRIQIGMGLQDYPTGIVNYRKTVSNSRRVTVDGRKRRLVRLSYG